MTEKLELHGHEVEFLKNEGKAIIEIDLGEASDECYLLDIFSVDGTDYVALISSESYEIYLFYYEDSFEEDEIDLRLIDDEEELEEVFHLFTHYWDDEAIDQVVEDYNSDLEVELEEIEDLEEEDVEDIDE
ncbi:DUF1292 domain-containing protein [Anaerococcus sp. Marseille-Q7828]|uniref:DUF1292 domain-containing protein n=1 Tax=Anaerococcus sp. Marseille-Q7828 TaxID=3036300 RepID=UPI0024AE190C|nr:DUF1292 domain-containing protein [Anaerococcus sp. Marseille-Q7828]